MLGRKPPKGGAAPASASPGTSRRGGESGANKRKWQEELSDESDAEPQITKDELEAWRKSVAEEERQEQIEREKREKLEREAALQRQKAEEEAQRRREEEEARKALKEAEEAKRRNDELLEAERQWQEDLAPPGPLPPDLPGERPPGMKADKMHLYKTTFCKRWEQGNCQFGAACHFAHGERELRGRPPRGSPMGTISELPKPNNLRGVTITVGGVTVPPLPASVLPHQSMGAMHHGVVPPPPPPQVIPPLMHMGAATAAYQVAGAVGPRVVLPPGVPHPGTMNVHVPPPPPGPYMHPG